MECNEVIALLDPLIDGELTGDDEANLTAHIAKCSSCKAELADMRKLQNDLKGVTTFSAPDSLRVNIQQKIKEESLESDSFWSITKAKIKSLFIPIANPVLTHAGAALFGAFLVYAVIQQPFKTNTLQSEIFNAHINSLAGNNLIAVKSNDQHTVKPWFAGKVKFSPYVPDLKDSGFTLLGGRVDNLKSKKVAVLIYLRNKHKINVFISPKTIQNTAHSGQWHSKGYNTVYWSDEVFSYSAISDLSMQGLKLFSGALTMATKEL
jgi:anti-sigma factor RsiW